MLTSRIRIAGNANDIIECLKGATSRSMVVVCVVM